RRAHEAQLLQQVGEGAPVEAGRAHEIVLLEGGERPRLAPREPKRAHAEDALRVDDVSDHLADAPLAGRVAEAGLLLVQRPEQRERLLELALQDRQDRARRHEADVWHEVIRVLPCGRTCVPIHRVLPSSFSAPPRGSWPIAVRRRGGLETATGPFAGAPSHDRSVRLRDLSRLRLRATPGSASSIRRRACPPPRTAPAPPRRWG